MRIIGYLISALLIYAPFSKDQNIENLAVFVLWVISLLFLFISFLPDEQWKKTEIKKGSIHGKIIFAAVVLSHAYAGWFITATVYLIGHGAAILKKASILKELEK